ncbi:MAG: hypothetical protein RLZZ80_103, partial [Pseudomonadota bacterium]
FLSLIKQGLAGLDGLLGHNADILE